MPRGTLEVVLADARGLDNNDFLAKISPYAVLTVKTQEKKSTVLTGKGSNPEWNQSFLFTISDDEVKELHLTIMDKDNFSADDYVGEATIPLLPAFVKGTVNPTTYNIVNKEKEFCGGVKLGLTFTPESGFLPGRSDHDSGEHGEEGSGGWKQSSDGEEIPGGWKQSSLGEERLGGRNEPSYGEERHGGRNEPPYGEERPPFGEERPPYGEGRPPCREERPPYGEDRPPFRGERPPYGEDRPPFGGERPPFRGERPPYGEERPPFGEEGPPFGEERHGGRNELPSGERPGGWRHSPFGEER
ncbi:hypothetical protein ACLB2K_074162 [Fragaria x ananassa]